MNKKIKKALTISIYTVIIISLIITCYFNYNSNILFSFNIIIAILILKKAKFSLISLQTVLANYVLFPAFMQYNYGESYGVLQLGILPLNYNYMNFGVVIYNIINLIFIYNTKFLEKEKKLLESKPKLKNNIEYVFATLAIIFTLISLPNLPFQIHDGRFIALKALLPGNAWNHLAIAFLIFCFSELKNSKFVKFAYAFVLFWFLSHFERVDALGLIIMTSLMIIVNSKFKIRKKYIRLGLVLGILGFFLLTALASIRANQSVTIEKMIRNVFVHSTASDIAYTYNVGIQYNIKYGNLNGMTYKTYILGVIPLIDQNETIELTLQDKYYTPGGAYILCEPIVNFGFLGIVMFKLLELFVLNKLVNSKLKISYYWYLFIIATIFRSQWYGLMYIEMGILYFIPILYFVQNIKKFK